MGCIENNVILLPKLFCPTVRNNCSSDRENFESTKSQLISKRFFEVVDFLQKTNKNKSHTSKNEFSRSFFGGN